MKVKIKMFTVNTKDITAITENDTDIIIEYGNGSCYMELDKELVTLDEVKTAIGW